MTSVWPQLRASLCRSDGPLVEVPALILLVRIVLVEEKIYPGNLSLKKSNFPAFFSDTHKPGNQNP